VNNLKDLGQSSLWYRPPEVLVAGVAEVLDCAAGIRSLAAVDMWSVGCFFAEAMIGSPLFESAETNFDLLCLHCDWLGYNFKSADGNLEVKSPDSTEGRPTLPDLVPGLCDHGYNLLSRMLSCNYLDRISARDALDHPFLAMCGCNAAIGNYFSESKVTIPQSDHGHRVSYGVDSSVKKIASFESYPSFLQFNSSDGVPSLHAVVQGLVAKRRLKRQRTEESGDSGPRRRIDAAPAV
jgi:serine/threonine protein kinase